MSRFGRVSANTCCYGNTLNIFGLQSLNLERGAIKLMLPQLHIVTKFAEHVYDFENMSAKNYGTHLKKQHGCHSRYCLKINDMF